MKFLLVFGFAVLLSACGTTKLTEHWQDESFSRNDLDNILIVAVTDSTANRFFFESTLKNAMHRAGLKGVTSQKVIGEEFPTKENVEKYLKANDIDYVVATRLAAQNVEIDRVPASVRTYYTGPYYASYGGYYHGYGNTVTMTREAYDDVKTTTVLVTTIFDAKTKKPVWIGRTEAFEAHSASMLAKDMAKAVWKNIDR